MVLEVLACAIRKKKTKQKEKKNQKLLVLSSAKIQDIRQAYKNQFYVCILAVDMWTPKLKKYNFYIL